MLNIIMLVVFSLVTIFFLGFIVENVVYAKRSIAIADTQCIVRSIGAIIVSIVSLIALWAQAAFYYFVV